MQALYIVVHPNDYFPRGTYLEDDGTGMVQETIMAKDDVTGRWIPSGYRGITLPLRLVRPWTIRIQKRGLDKTW